MTMNERQNLIKNHSLLKKSKINSHYDDENTSRI